MMIKGYQAELMDIYDKIRTEENRKLKLRHEDIQNKYPEIIELENTIKKLCVNLATLPLKGNFSEAHLTQLKEEIIDLRARKYEYLVSKGYPPEYLNLHYHCNKCKDTGYIGINKCSCFKTKLIKLYYKDSELQDAVKVNNFNNFNINLYSTHKLGDDKISPRGNMQSIVDFIKGEYLPNFKDSDTNLVVYGNSGT